MPVSQSMLKEKALEFADDLRIEGFQESGGWLDKWKKRYVTNFCYRKIKTFIPRPSSAFAAFPSALILQKHFLPAFKK